MGRVSADQPEPAADPDGTTVVRIDRTGHDHAERRSRLAEEARALIVRALVPSLRDDRFDEPWPPDGLVAAIDHSGGDHSGGEPTGYLGGTVDRGRFQLSGLLAEPDGGATPGDADIDGPVPEAVLEQAERLWAALQPAVLDSGAEMVELWGHVARPWHAELARRHGLTEARALHQLRCPLPIDVDATPVDSRPFRPGHDEDALIRVNNRAFAAHPDQGGMTRATIEEAAARSWFDPDGIRLLDDPERPGLLAGFCWTKIHEPVTEGQPRLGEIYAIGIDPDHHGRGLGAPMTAAGLAWLAGQGLTTGMLYVEADNEPALRTYHRLGFSHHRTDRAWHRAVAR